MLYYGIWTDADLCRSGGRLHGDAGGHGGVRHSPVVGDERAEVSTEYLCRYDVHCVEGS